jgi:hypothetical protein
MTVTHRFCQALVLLGLFSIIAPGCRRPEAPERKGEPEAPTAKEEPAAAPAEEAPGSPLPLDDDDVLPDDGDIVAPEVIAPQPEVEEASIPTGTELHIIRKGKKEQILSEEPPALRTKLHGMRRTIDRRLLWARKIIERRATIEGEVARLAERAEALSLTTQVPIGPQTEALEAQLGEVAVATGLQLTDLSFEEVPPDLARLPDTFAGDKPLELTEADFVGTVRLSFVVGTMDKGRLGSWYEALVKVPRFVIVNRIRSTGEAFQIVGEAYYLADRAGPIRQEQTSDLEAELVRAGVALAADEVRHKDPDHFLIAAEVSLGEFNAILEEANEISALEGRAKRSEVILEWLQTRLRARADRPYENLFR